MASIDRLAEIGIEIAPADDLHLQYLGDDKEDGLIKGAPGKKHSSGGEAEMTSMGDGSPEITAYMKKFDPIKELIERIRRNNGEIDKLRVKDRTTANEKGRKEIMSELDAIMKSTTKAGQECKAYLDHIKAENAKYNQENKDSAKSQMRENMYQTYIRRFHSVMNDYNQASYEFKKNLQERTKRQLKIVDEKLTDEEAEALVDSGQAQEVIKQALISENLLDAVAEVEERHVEILKLERQVQEVFELFKDLATLVDLQQESLDVIDSRIQNSKAYIAKGEQELVKAEASQKSARSKRCCLFIILIGILCAIIFPTLISVGSFKNS